ncbi:endonuclease/exonuclease/phosphatase family protein [Panacibacter ginsenosidivorans]|uniref:Endonuclease/exonuclease/phosphatase family protein n=1 Tax=Panacibacter ginsenosidivorans TaxID=1813871 RepID=A0A5B8V6N9_9BACT|nr:endonuclease/exonuclease/phosphatase family protein [Panacibacter ginsenosidivorans]QEC66952.1 endonuclease/exonuclease/phosphatase family protein [Panacibacter ginsenosidivorans]
MKIITWNCNMAFRKKAATVFRLQPDVLVIPECEHPDKLMFINIDVQPTQILWFGANHHKGLAIIAFNNYKLKLLDVHNPAFKMIIPIRVTGNKRKFNLFAVWANNPQDKDGKYVEQVWKAVNHYDKYLKKTSTILAGDFNSNAIWDRKRRIGNHSTVVKRLEEKGIYSTYHQHHKQMQGKEEHPTFFLYKNKDKPYHLDYCFVSKDLLQKLRSVEIGDHTFWMQYSDHVPVIVRFDD